LRALVLTSAATWAVRFAINALSSLISFEVVISILLAVALWCQADVVFALNYCHASIVYCHALKHVIVLIPRMLFEGSGLVVAEFVANSVAGFVGGFAGT
jgi:hypothetical protein